MIYCRLPFVKREYNAPTLSVLVHCQTHEEAKHVNQLLGPLFTSLETEKLTAQQLAARLYNSKRVEQCFQGQYKCDEFYLALFSRDKF